MAAASARPPGVAAPPRSLAGLDWFNFFVANFQTGFGPFIAVYLSSRTWTEAEIGVVLSVGTVTAMVSQVPAGALVDAMPNKRFAALLAVASIAGSAVIFAIWPERLAVAIAEVLHGFASCVLSPSIAAISLALVGQAALGERLGRNARFAALGNGIAAAVMGACGKFVSTRAVFVLTALLCVPGLAALRAIHGVRAAAPVNAPVRTRLGAKTGIWRLLHDRRLLVFGVCVIFFHISNAAMLPIAGVQATREVGTNANLIIAAAIVVPQMVVAWISPWIGREASLRGRRIVLELGFAALPVRGVLLALIPNPYLLMPIQALDGVSGAVFGVLLPLVAADITRGTDRFNTCLGLLGLAVGIGATISTTLAGYAADLLGARAAFLVLAAAGMVAVLLVRFALPETRPAEEADEAAEAAAA
ncbi:MAG TPA: MFS transporter [Acetobacteraceae bacterium]|nr:MFS transporter [Acetobacteraceae bacterium]